MVPKLGLITSLDVFGVVETVGWVVKLNGFDANAFDGNVDDDEPNRPSNFVVDGFFSSLTIGAGAATLPGLSVLQAIHFVLSMSFFTKQMVHSHFGLPLLNSSFNNGVGVVDDDISILKKSI